MGSRGSRIRVCPCPVRFPGQTSGASGRSRIIPTSTPTPSAFRPGMNQACLMRQADGRNMARRVKTGPMRQHYQCLTLTSLTKHAGRGRRRGRGCSGIGSTKDRIESNRIEIATGMISTAVAVHGSTHGRLTHDSTSTLSGEELRAGRRAGSWGTMFHGGRDGPRCSVHCVCRWAFPSASFQDHHTCSSKLILILGVELKKDGR